MDYVNQPLKNLNKRYKGTAYIAVATPGSVIGEARQSIHNLRRRPGDSSAQFFEHTKGQDAREKAIHTFLDSAYDWIFFMDGDMLIPPFALERLRSHGFACTSGHYLRRTFDPPIPIWFEDDRREGWEYIWPFMPFRQKPAKGRLYRLGGTGFGCWLIHREVLEAVEPLLCGERFVWEDDMDVWPYDLRAVLRGEEKLRPLRCDKETIGADVRLAFFIRVAGYTIWGDPAVDCGHYIDYPLSLLDRNLGPAFDIGWHQTTTEEISAIQQENTANFRQVVGGAA